MTSANAPALIFIGLLGAWFGAALFYVAVMGPAALQAGASGIGFLRGLARRGGTGRFYAVFAFLTVIAGIWMYVANGMYNLAGAGNLWATLSLALAALALLLGASLNRTAEGTWVNAVKNAAAPGKEASDIASVLAKAERANAVTTAAVGLALLCAIFSQTVR